MFILINFYETCLVISVRHQEHHNETVNFFITMENLKNCFRRGQVPLHSHILPRKKIRKSRQPKIQQNKTTLVLLPLTTLGLAGNEVGLFYNAPEPTRGEINATTNRLLAAGYHQKSHPAYLTSCL